MLDKKTKIAIFALIIFPVGTLAVFLYVENRQNVSEELPQEQGAVIVPVGDAEQAQLILDDGSEISILIQAYNLRDTHGNMIDVSNVQSVQISYPHREDFLEFPINAMPDGAIFELAIWPQETLGEHVFRIEYKDGTIREEAVNWQGAITRALSRVSIEASGTRLENDGTVSRAYQIEGLDPSSFEEMYRIDPENSVTKIEVSQDEYFWLRASDAMAGNHTLLIKKEGIWYQSSMLVIDKGAIEDL